MRLKILFVVLAAFSLAACASQATQPPASPAPTLMPATPTIEVGCSVVSAQPTPAPETNPLFPAVSETDFTLGPEDAPVTLIEYCDFQAPGCRGMAGIISQLRQNHPDELRVVFRPLPLIGILDKSDLSVRAALAADAQGRFWEMHDLLFAKYDEWVSLTPAEFEAWVRREASGPGLDRAQFSAAFNSSETADRMNSMYEAAKQIGVPSVPLVLINGALQPSYVLDYGNMNAAISLIILGERQFAECPPFSVDTSKQYLAALHTEKGEVLIELFANKAPLAVNSFLFLAQQGWFDGVTFHRVIPGFMAQTGDPSGTGQGNPGYFFKNEISDLRYDKPGMVGMANSGADTNGSQFFITFAPAAHLDGSYTIFGQVISGMEVVEQLAPRDPQQNPFLPPGDKLLSVEIEEK